MNRAGTYVGWIAIATAVVISPQAFAHAGHSELLRMDVEKNEVRVTFSMDGDHLLAFDGNGDGKLSKKEYSAAHASIAAWIDERVVFVGRDHMRAKAVFSDIPVTGFDDLADDDEVEHIRVLRNFPVTKGDGSMMIRYNIFDEEGATRHYAVWNAGKVSEGVLTPESNVVTIVPPQ